MLLFCVGIVHTPARILYLELFDIASHTCGSRQERHPVEKNAAPILFINTPRKGVLWGGSPTLSENGLWTDDIIYIYACFISIPIFLCVYNCDAWLLIFFNSQQQVIMCMSQIWPLVLYRMIYIYYHVYCPY